MMTYFIFYSSTSILHDIQIGDGTWIDPATKKPYLIDEVSWGYDPTKPFYYLDIDDLTSHSCVSTAESHLDYLAENYPLELAQAIIHKFGVNNHE